MMCIQRGIAVVCVFLLLAPIAGAQVPGVKDSGGGFSSIVRPYQFQELAPIDLSNSNRLEQLLRGGNIYLSLQDAIALALENNLDIAIQRYGPINADASLLRAKAGGPLRGVPTSVQTVTTNILSQVTGTGSGTGGGERPPSIFPSVTDTALKPAVRSLRRCNRRLFRRSRRNVRPFTDFVIVTKRYCRKRSPHGCDA